MQLAFYLNGVYVDTTNNKLVATDGHTLAIISQAFDPDNQLPQTIIPLEASLMALKVNKGKAQLTLTPTHLGDVPYTPIDGNFPNYQQVIHEPNPEQTPGNYQPEYVLKAHKAFIKLCKLRKSTDKISLYQNGPAAAAMMTCTQAKEALYIIMPTRLESNDAPAVSWANS